MSTSTPHTTSEPSGAGAMRRFTAVPPVLAVALVCAGLVAAAPGAHGAAARTPRPTGAPVVTSSPGTSYRAVRLRPLDADHPVSIPSAAAGDLVVGQSFLTGFGERAAVWTADGSVRDLGTFGGPSALAHDVSSAGVVVGSATYPDFHSDGFRWTATDGLQALPRPSSWQGAVASAVTESGLIVGHGFDAAYIERGLVWRPGAAHEQVVSDAARRTVAVGADEQGNAYFRTTRLVADQSPGKGTPSDQLLRVPPSGAAVDLLADLTARDVTLRLRRADVNDAGEVVALVDGRDGRARVYRWEATKPKPVLLGLAANPWGDVAVGDDGSVAWTGPRTGGPMDVVVGGPVVVRADGKRTVLDGLDTHGAGATGIGPDGTVVGFGTGLLGGTGRERALAWQAGSAPVDLSATPDKPGGEQSRATAVLPDGRILGVTGNEGEDGVVWVPSARVRTVVRLRPTADTYVDEGDPDGVHGGTTSLGAASPAGGAARRALLRFAVPPAPVGTRLVSATVTVRTTKASDAGSEQPSPIVIPGGAWSELGTSWRNRPSDTQTPAGAFKPVGVDRPTSARLLPTVVRPGSDLDLDVTGSGDALRFCSREHARDSARPSLVLTYEETD